MIRIEYRKFYGIDSRDFTKPDDLTLRSKANSNGRPTRVVGFPQSKRSILGDIVYIILYNVKEKFRQCQKEFRVCRLRRGSKRSCCVGLLMGITHQGSV